MSSTKVVYWGTGRRKTAVARVRVVPGTGTVTINGRPGDNYLNYNPVYLAAVTAPLQTLGLASEYDILVNVRGGGLTGQADAIKGMLPHNALGRQLFRKLKVYSGAEHPHAAQQPQVLTLDPAASAL